MSLASPDPGVSELVANIRLLELVARRNAAGFLAGDYVTSIPGQGLLFHETRKYVPGEPARRIDWNITARLGEPYVKVHLEERQRDVIVALDTSPSMHTGFQDKTKLELGVELAATLAVSAVESGDRLGHVLFADRVIDESRPSGGRKQLFRVLRSLLDNVGGWKREVAQSDPRAAIEAIEHQPGRRFVVFLISDFIDHDLPEDLKFVRARHDVSLMHVYDPVEFEVARAVRFRAVSPEAGTGPSAAAGKPVWISPGETGSLAETEQFLRTEAARFRIEAASFSTAVPVPESLGAFLHSKRRRATR
ncbi:MAG: DUF58 domain-containing protein [Thermoanaerobaculia bacterium]